MSPRVDVRLRGHVDMRACAIPEGGGEQMG